MDPQVGQVINNKYRLVRLIGDGGMGSVFEARHELLGTTVALKFLHAMLARRKGLVDRFLQEAQVSARIKSSHVVTVSDVDRTPEGLAFMVMEFVDGDTLQTLYEKNYQAGKRLSYGEAFDYMLQVIDGVAAAHALGIVHRDLKPDNIMLTRANVPPGRSSGVLVKVLDFGIAKLKASGEVDRGLTRPGVVMGTPEYMAPEQAFSADRVDVRADIFSLGVMFFEMLAGRRPVGGDNAHAIAAQYLEGQIAQLRELVPSISPELAAAVHRAMSAQPEDRFPTVAAFREAIAPFAPDRGKSAAFADTFEADEEGVPATVPPDKLYAAAASAEPSGDQDDDDPGARLSSEGPGRTSVAAGFAVDGPTGEPTTDAARAAADALRGSTEGVPHEGGTAAMPEVDPLRAGTAPMGDETAIAQGLSRGTQVAEPNAAAMVAPTAGAPPGWAAGRTVVGDESGRFDVAQATPGGLETPGYAPAPYVPARPRKRGGGSFASVLGIAALISGLVMGGVYVAHRASQGGSAGDHELPRNERVDIEDDAPTPEPELPQPEPEPQTEVPPVEPVPVPQPPVSQPPPRPPVPQPPVTKPQPPQPQPPQPQPTPPLLPTVLPSQLPFPIPGLPGIHPRPQPQPPQTQPPQPQPPQPQPPPPPKHKIPFPKIKTK